MRRWHRRRRDTQRNGNFTDHFKELRRRLIVVAVCFLLATLVAFIFATPIFRYLTRGLPPLVQLSPGEIFGVYLRLSALVGALVTIPVALWQAWAFAKPGLLPAERRMVYFYLPSAVLLFVAGASFGFFVLYPNILHFMITFSHHAGVEVMLSASQTITFMINLVFPTTLIFELPVVASFLTEIHLITPGLLKKGRKIAVLVAFVIAGVLTPPDVLSQTLVALPFIALYEGAIALSRWTYRRVERRNALAMQPQASS